MIEFFYPENSYTRDLGNSLARFADLTIACKKKIPVPSGSIKWKTLLYEGYHSRLAAPFLYGKSLLQLGIDIWKNRYDVVHIQYMRAPAIEIKLFRLLRNRYGILVDTIHTLIPHEASDKDKELHRSIYRSCDLMIVHNQICREQLIHEFGVPEHKICVMPHGLYPVDSNKCSEYVERPDEKIHFLMFGQLRKYKGVDILLKAVSLIPLEERSRISVTIAGPQYTKLDDTDYEAMAEELGIEDYVNFVRRHIPPEEHAELFADTDICVLPYKELYGSGALIMAYAYEKPVIVSDDPIFMEETENGSTGLLFAKNDPKALADAILEATEWKAGDHKLRKDHIRSMNKTKFSWDRSAEISCKAYEAAIKYKENHKTK